MSDAPFDTTRITILDAALPDVPFDGWSEALFRRAVAAAGVDPGHARLAFPRGALDLAVAFHRRGDVQMVEQLDTPEFSALGMTRKITTAIHTRLKIAEPHEEAIRRATAMFALPFHAPEGARLTWETADRIWNATGDTTEDYNWYTKRLTLSGVFSSTLLCWLADTSPEKQETWHFLDRRINDVMRIEKAKGRMRTNPLARMAMAGPNAILSRLRAPRDGAGPKGLGVGLPGSSGR